MNILQNKFKFPLKKPNLPYKLNGWFDNGNQLLLQKYLNKNTKIVIEFGSWLGLSADFIMKHTNDDCIIICVDWWKGDSSIGYAEDPEYLYNTFLVNMWQYKNKLIPVRMDGRKAMEYLSKLGIDPDLIYLDMDHSYESVKGDLELLMKYFPNKLILGDDIFYWNGVAKAVKETIHKYKIHNIEINKNCYAFIPDNYNKLESYIPIKCDTKFQLKDIKLSLLITDNNKNKIKQNIAIIIGYKKDIISKTKIQQFIQYISLFMKKTKLNFKIFIIQQSSKQQYNLGKLYNIGYTEALKQEYNIFIFHNISLLPNEDMINYYKMYPHIPIQLGYPLSNYLFERWYLGILMINSKDFIELNGYPNNIIEWNGWDYDLYLRFTIIDKKLGIPHSGSLKTINNFNLMSEKKWRQIKQNDIINKHATIWEKNGLSNLKYKVKKIKTLNEYCIKINI